MDEILKLHTELGFLLTLGGGFSTDKLPDIWAKFYRLSQLGQDAERELAEAKLEHKDWIKGEDGRLHCPCHFAAEQRLAEVVAECRASLDYPNIYIGKVEEHIIALAAQEGKKNG
jgi:hypothetical protein